MTQSTQSRGRSYPPMMPLIGEPEGHRAPRYHPPLNQASVASGNTRRPTPAKRITTPAEARADERKRVAEGFASTAGEGRDVVRTGTTQPTALRPTGPISMLPSQRGGPDHGRVYGPHTVEIE